MCESLFIHPQIVREKSPLAVESSLNPERVLGLDPKGSRSYSISLLAVTFSTFHVVNVSLHDHGLSE